MEQRIGFMGEDVIEILVSPYSDSLVNSLVDASHGVFDHKDIRVMLQHQKAFIIKINDRLTTGITWEDGVLSFFGFHGDMRKEDLAALDVYSLRIAREKGLKKIQFLSDHKAWMRLLKPLKYKTILFVYEKEV